MDNPGNDSALSVDILLSPPALEIGPSEGAFINVAATVQVNQTMENHAYQDFLNQLRPAIQSAVLKAINDTVAKINDGQDV